MRRSALLLLLLPAGCWPGSIALPPGRPPGEVQSGPAELRVSAEAPPLRPVRKVPVLAPPEVFAAFVPAHARGDLMVGEHWVYFKLRDAEWYAERRMEPESPADGEAPPGLLRPLEHFDWSRIAVPHR
jgi:hypothetical protein